ncbi:MAG: peptide chain release factor 2 [Candidatus Aminicenantes bacterium]|nr:MAG: peptide chain release factor 2 [Candidatus Aminicenantes bacterium]
MTDIVLQLKELQSKLHQMMDVFDIAKKREKIKELEKKTEKSDFWQDKERARKTSQEIAKIREELEEFNELEIKLELLKEEKDEKKIEDFKRELKQKELRVFLSGKYDKGNAILEISAGAGGQDSQDWATMLLRVYERYCALKGYKTKILSQSFGEGGGPEGRIGTKQVSLEIKGASAYGFLKRETGVHRLVRISPFSAKNLRHTSFALVEVLPEISEKEEPEIKIRPEDLKLETFRASGPGGQYVNRRESAVRITHLPTGIQAASQAQRLQGLNRETAMKVLTAKLYQLKQLERQKKLKEIKGKEISASWGNQIRSYILHPYKLVKDLRTKVQTSDIEGVLDGNLDKFIEAEIKYNS